MPIAHGRTTASGGLRRARVGILHVVSPGIRASRDRARAGPMSCTRIRTPNATRQQAVHSVVRRDRRRHRARGAQSAVLHHWHWHADDTPTTRHVIARARAPPGTAVTSAFQILDTVEAARNCAACHDRSVCVWCGWWRGRRTSVARPRGFPGPAMRRRRAVGLCHLCPARTSAWRSLASSVRDGACRGRPPHVWRDVA
ncbi:hypothetical protein DAEQUDRAFT_145744 [Daedalea quercina L-15889]|uniref:Uncharacterized protein n=1 Tax=Daedalea quercina L-15889 TaxID=1314783 RepID=A0A165KNP0_9APHY|nr:hypothetical protein DAEQUDRAFT_145744 [Daedalea quercina L-15889]